MTVYVINEITQYTFHRLSTFLGDRDSIRDEKRKMKEIFFFSRSLSLCLASTRHSNRAEKGNAFACVLNGERPLSFVRLLASFFPLFKVEKIMISLIDNKNDT